MSEEIIKKQKTRIEELEGELSIVKGIGMNSPEMREAKARIKELERDREILKQDIDRLSEYSRNLETMMRTRK
jgi:lipid II:glycine glycyltransferase (peptidoglycan interpeptide bridge formation enzyme)|tara:strand:- start:211 stop:429 length:219 start_codon:yes stop_codon:yes gene_type:complete